MEVGAETINSASSNGLIKHTQGSSIDIQESKFLGDLNLVNS